MTPPEKLDAQVVDMQPSVLFQFLTSLLPVRRGWFANHSLHRTGPSRSGFFSHLLSARSELDSLGQLAGLLCLLTSAQF
jgi:hypothetical protein